MNPITIYNLSKSRYETVSFDFTAENTTWFKDSDSCQLRRIADTQEGLLIQETGYTYPILIGGLSRADIANDGQKALELLRQIDQI